MRGADRKPVTRSLPATLRAYRMVMRAAGPLASLFLNYRLRRGKEHAVRLRERMGESSVPRPEGPLVWLHGASVGEITSIMPLVERIRSRDFTVLVTSGTVTSADLAGRRLPADVIHQFLPLDAPQFVARFLDWWKPDLGLFVESDLWPNLIIAASDRSIPLIVLNGRLSERSFHRWQRLPGTIGAMMSRFDLCLAQSTDDAARFAGLGAPRITTTGNLKLDAPAPPADEQAMRALEAATAGRTIVAATSTHPGEETVMVDVHRKLKHTFNGLLTMIAPRHPERGQGIAEIAKVAGLTAKLRSAGELPDESTDIYIVDTLGELGLVYRLAPLVFIGGSLIGHGGQNPIEAAKLGVAILHGPNVWNFSEIYLALDAAGGAEHITDPSKLAVRIGALLTDSDARKAMANTALRAMDTLSGALDRTLTAIDPYLMEFRLQGRTDDA